MYAENAAIVTFEKRHFYFELEFLCAKKRCRQSLLLSALFSTRALCLFLHCWEKKGASKRWRKTSPTAELEIFIGRNIKWSLHVSYNLLRKYWYRSFWTSVRAFSYNFRFQIIGSKIQKSCASLWTKDLGSNPRIIITLPPFSFCTFAKTALLAGRKIKIKWKIHIS